MRMPKLSIRLLLLTILLVDLTLLLGSGYNHRNDMVIPLSMTLVLACTYIIFTELKFITIAIVTMLGFLAAMIIKIIIDIFMDPTSHNLLPFEIIIDFAVGFLASLLGVAIGLLVRLIMNTFKKA